MEAEQIDRSKENIQPLRQGRASSQLSEALSAQATINIEVQQAIQQKIQDFELALRTYEGDDLLEPWFNYISWVEQYFPKHGKEGNFPKLLSKCLALFQDTEEYKQDTRYVRLWIKYLEMRPEPPGEMFEMVLNHGIGTKVAQFYHSWAMEMVKLGDLRRADQVYRLGISAGAQPADDLDQAHKNLQFKLLRQGLEEGGEVATDPRAVVRPALGRLEASGDLNAVPHERGQPLHAANWRHQQSTAQPPPVVNKAKFSLFRDENRPVEEVAALPTPQLLKSFPCHKTLRAENTVEAARWTESASRVPSTPQQQLTTPFKVHTDSVVTAPPSSARRNVPTSVLQERRAREEEWRVPLAIFEPPNPKVRPMYCKDKVYAGGTELSLEELRAERYLKRQRTLQETRASESAMEGVSLRENGDVLQPNERIVASQVHVGAPEVSFEEERVRQYLQRHKEKEEKARQEKEHKARQEKEQKEKEASTQPQDEPPQGSYQVAAGSRLMVTFATLVCGVEHSLEELRAQRYVTCQQTPAQKEPIRRPVEDTWDVPIALFEPPNPKQRPMYIKDKVYSQNTEHSLEELRAIRYISSMQVQHPSSHLHSDTRTPSANSSRGTTPSSTPGMGHSMLGQSMTLNTKEAMAAMKDLWCSRAESPVPVPNPPAPAFSIFCDSNPASAPFQIYSAPAVENVPQGDSLLKRITAPKRGLQLTDEYEGAAGTREAPLEREAEPQQAPQESWPEIRASNRALTKQYEADINQGLSEQPERKPFSFDIYQEPVSLQKTSSSRKSLFVTKQEQCDYSDMPVNTRNTVSNFQIYQMQSTQEAELLSHNAGSVTQQEEVVAASFEQKTFSAGFDIYKEAAENRRQTEYALPETDFNKDYQSRQSLGVKKICPWATLSTQTTYIKQEVKEVVENHVEDDDDTRISGKQPWSIFLPPPVVPEEICSDFAAPPFPTNYEIPYVPPPADDDDNFDDDQNIPNKENVSPSNQPVASEPRQVAGILLESQDIPFIPLEEQEKMLQQEENNEETELGVRPMRPFVDDLTLGSLTTQFKQPLFSSSSTPYHQSSQSLLGRITSTDDRDSPVDPPAETAKEQCSAVQEVWEAQEMAARHLSPILEMTGESRGSRSGSSSGSSGGSRLLYANFTSHGISKTPGQLSGGDSRMTFMGLSKTPGQLSGDSCLASEKRPVRLRLLEEEEEEKVPAVAFTEPLQLMEAVSFKERVELQTSDLQTRPCDGEVVEVERGVAELGLGDVDPFSSLLQSRLLASLASPLTSRPGYLRVELPLPQPRVSQCLPLDGCVAKLRRSLGEGAYAKVYKGVVGKEERPVVLKVAPGDTTCWDFYISSEIQQRLTNPQLASQFSTIRSTFLYNNGVIYEMGFESNVSLLDVVNQYKTEGLEVPPVLVLYLSAQLLRLVQVLHSCNIIHADVKLDNLLVITSEDNFSARLQLIDFGRCIDMRLFPKNTTFTEVFKVPDSRCVEMRTNRPWTYQLDLYSAAASVHCLLFGKYMNIMESRGKWIPTCKPKRFWEHSQVFEQLFETLLNVESCDKIPDLTPLIGTLQSAADKNSLMIGKELARVLGKLRD